MGKGETRGAVIRKQAYERTRWNVLHEKWAGVCGGKGTETEAANCRTLVLAGRQCGRDNEDTTVCVSAKVDLSFPTGCAMEEKVGSALSSGWNVEAEMTTEMVLCSRRALYAERGLLQAWTDWYVWSKGHHRGLWIGLGNNINTRFKFPAACRVCNFF